MNYFGNMESAKIKRTKALRRYLEKSMNIKKYDNIFEALYVSRIIRKVCGIMVLDLKKTDDGILINKFSWIGFIFFLIWYSLYFYCALKAHTKEQTILWNMYRTRVQRYGDDCERAISIVYVIFGMWKLPFRVSGNTSITQIIINVDSALEHLGEKIDYNKDAYTVSALSVAEIIVYLIRLLCIWLILKSLNVAIPLERMYQVGFSDTLVLVVTAYYCYYLTVIRSRFRYVNKILLEINTLKSWEYKIFVRGRMAANGQKAENIQDKYLSDKIKSCAKIYSMLYKSVLAVNDLFGLMLVMTIFISLVNIILYLFYFMEATSGGLFHDLSKYVKFSIYVVWQTGFAIGILYLIVYFCESIMSEARETTYFVHEIISSGISPLVTTEAMHLSLQLLHQRPIFTAYGLYKLNYALFEQGARSVSTYLVILLQFVTDANV